MATKRLSRLSLLVAAAGLTVAAFVFVISPLKSHFGIVCPGCGSTRALAAFFHGNLYEAFYWHPLFPLYIVGAVIIAIAFVVYLRRKELHPLDFTADDLNALLGSIVKNKAGIPLIIIYVALFFGIWILRITGGVGPDIIAPLR